MRDRGIEPLVIANLIAIYSSTELIPHVCGHKGQNLGMLARGALQGTIVMSYSDSAFLDSDLYDLFMGRAGPPHLSMTASCSGKH